MEGARTSTGRWNERGERDEEEEKRQSEMMGKALTLERVKEREGGREGGSERERKVMAATVKEMYGRPVGRAVPVVPTEK